MCKNGLSIDADCVIDAILNDRKPTTGVWSNLILALGQAYHAGEYEPPEVAEQTYPQYADDIRQGDGYLKSDLARAALLAELWRKVYNAASEKRNQVGIDQIMDWGAAFADRYAEFRVSLENQKNFVCSYLPALKKIEDLQAKLAELPDTTDGLEFKRDLSDIKELLLNMTGKMDANREAEQDEHTKLEKDVLHRRKEFEKRPGLTQEQAADVIKILARDKCIDQYTTCTVRTIQNWESASGKHKAPMWYPGRNCELATFKAKVSSGLNAEQITRIHRESIRQAQRPPIRIQDDGHLDRLLNPTSYKKPRRKTDDD